VESITVKVQVGDLLNMAIVVRRDDPTHKTWLFQEKRSMYV